MGQALMFKLHQQPGSRGLRCDVDGLFLGGDALLEQDEEGKFLARPAADLRKLFSGIYRDETDWERRIRSVALVANALNRKDMACAMMTAVLIRLPDPKAPPASLMSMGFLPRRDSIRTNRGMSEADGQQVATAERTTPMCLTGPLAFSLPMRA